MTTKETGLAFPRWALALALFAALGLGLLAFFKLSTPKGVSGADAGPPVAARAPRSPAPPSVASRPRAGISGHVFDPVKKPLAWATVCSWAGRTDGLTTAQRVPRCTTTQADGAYALTDLFPATPLALSASATSFPAEGFHGANGEDEIRLGEGEQRKGVDFVLRAGAVLVKGSVNDVTGGVVAGAVVVTTETEARAMTTSDSKGEFSLWVEPGDVHLGATASGYAPASSDGPAPGHFFAIHLVPGATLVGRAVVAGTDTPVENAMIEAIQVEGGQVRASVRTEADGHFKIDGLTPGRFRIEATSEGREGYSGQSITLGMGETSQEVKVELDPAYVVRGRVVEKGSGTPCKAGQVTITDSKQNEYSQATIEPDGWARMASVIPGHYKVEVRCEGFVAREDYPDVDIKAEDAPPLTWEVEKGASVRVTVVDADGKPVTRGSVSVTPTSREGRAPGGSADHAEADGAFLVAGLGAGGARVSASSDDGASADKEVTLAGTSEERVRIELPASGVIDGLVEDDEHRPVAHVRVHAIGPASGSATSLDDGSFKITGLPSGEYELMPSENEFQRSFQERQEEKRPEVKVSLKAPDHAKAKVTVAKRGGSVAGRVVDGSGQPVTDAFIDFARAVGDATGVPRYQGSARAPIVSDTDGRFKIDGLVDGDYNLRAYRKGGGEATADHIKVGTQNVALTLGDGGSISGTLTAANKPVERFNVRVHNQKSSFYRVELFFHAQGAFSIKNLPAGTYDVYADTPQGLAKGEVTLAEGEQKTGVALVMNLRGTLSGRFVDLETGAPVPAPHINVGGTSPGIMSDASYRTNQAGPDGHFSIEGILAGHVDLHVGGVTIPVDVKEGGGVTDVGNLRIPKPRVGPREARGDLGVFVPYFGSEGPLDVSHVSGAAEEAGVVTGDVVVSVDGFDVTGQNRYLFPVLIAVPAGRKVALGLSGKAAVTLEAR